MRKANREEGGDALGYLYRQRNAEVKIIHNATDFPMVKLPNNSFAQKSESMNARAGNK